MARAVLVHGIRNSEPDETMGPLDAALYRRGVETDYADYGYILVPLTNGRAEKAIKESAQPGDTIVAYSNGAAAAIEVAEHVAARNLVLISPAARTDQEYSPHLKSITVFYSPGDWIVGLGGMYSDIVSAMPWRWGTPHGWGRLGVDGPETSDHRVTGLKMGDDIAHTWYSNPKVVNRIAKRVEEVMSRG